MLIEVMMNFSTQFSVRLSTPECEHILIRNLRKTIKSINKQQSK